MDTHSFATGSKVLGVEKKARSTFISQEASLMHFIQQWTTAKHKIVLVRLRFFAEFSKVLSLSLHTADPTRAGLALNISRGVFY